jgi:hypothetical protein
VAKIDIAERQDLPNEEEGDEVVSNPPFNLSEDAKHLIRTKLVERLLTEKDKHPALKEIADFLATLSEEKP